jgi:hypothetical protein
MKRGGTRHRPDVEFAGIPSESSVIEKDSSRTKGKGQEHGRPTQQKKQGVRAPAFSQSGFVGKSREVALGGEETLSRPSFGSLTGMSPVVAEQKCSKSGYEVREPRAGGEVKNGKKENYR